MRQSQKELPNYHGPDPRGGVPVLHNSWLAVPALTVIPLIRYPVGNKVASPGNAIIVALFLTGAAPWVALFVCGLLGMQKLPDNLGYAPPGSFPVFSVATLLQPLPAFSITCAGVCLFVWAWRLLRLGHAGSVHQMEAGYSWPARLTPLPLWSTEIFLVLLATGYAGWLVFSGPSLTLGAWLMLCGLSLAAVGFAEFRHRLSVSGSVTDLHSQGQAAGASLSGYSGSSSTTGSTPGQKPGKRTIAEAATPTGMAMQAEGGGGRPGLFLFSFGRRPRRADARKGEVSPTYAEPG